MKKYKLKEGLDYYVDERSGHWVFTAHFHLTRGHCCGNGCRECPFVPKNIKGNKNLKDIEE